MDGPFPSERARARHHLTRGEPGLALGICEAALGGAAGVEALALRLLAAECAAVLGDLPGRVEQLEAAEGLARAVAPAGLGVVLRQLGAAWLEVGRAAQAVLVLEEALGRGGEPDAERARLEELLARARAAAASHVPAGPGAASAAPSDAVEGEAEAGADAAGELEPGPQPPAAERLLAMIDRLLEGESDLPLPALLDLILAELVQAVGAERGFVLLREPGEGLAIRAARDARGEAVADPEREVSRTVAERAASEARPIRAVRPAEDPRFVGSRSARALDLRALVAAPLRYRRVDLGCVLLDRRGQDVAFDGAAEDLVARFARLASGLIVRTRRREADVRRAEALTDLFARGTAQLQERLETCGLIGESEAVYAMLRLLERVAPTEARVLIRGESGTGKELVARILHQNSSRRAADFVAINCAALPDALLAGELFGHVRGAFTSADADQPGLFERAHQGTLFLDEIGDASPRLQAELLRVLQEGEVRRLGDTVSRPVDVRVLAATHQDLEAMVAEGRFREDLLYRLNVIEVRVPPLRERRGDLPLLVRSLAREIPNPAHPLDDRALARFAARPWRGNIRELRNAVTSYLTLGTLPEPLTPPPPPQPPGTALPGTAPDEVLTLEEAERRAIVRALRATGGARQEAATLLQIGRRTLYNKIKLYGLD